MSDESGRPEVYVQPYPLTGAKWQVSTDGGHHPRWRRDGKELYWTDGEGTLMAVEVSAGPAFQRGIPQRLFQTGIAEMDVFAVSGDGKRFLIPRLVDEAHGAHPLTVVQNWLAGAKK